PSTTQIDTLSLHDALPISFRASPNAIQQPLAHRSGQRPQLAHVLAAERRPVLRLAIPQQRVVLVCGRDTCGASLVAPAIDPVLRSEEHTSELQSRENLVCR